MPDGSSLPQRAAPGWLRAVADTFVPSWMSGGPHRRLARSLYRVRLLIAFSALTMSWALPGATPAERRTFVLLVGLVYLPYAVVLALASRRTDHPLLRVATVVSDLLVVFLFQATLPPTRIVSLFGYLLILAIYAYLGGLAAGLAIAVAAMALTGLAQVFAPSIDPYTLAMYAAVLVSLALLLDSVTRQQRRAAGRLASLNDSLRASSSALELPDMLDAVNQSAKTSLGAAFSAVLLEETGELLTGSVEGLEASSEVAELTREALTSPTSSPAAFALRTAEPVVVRDVTADPRFSGWSRVGRGLGFSAAIVAPLPGEEAPIGVLVAGFADDDAVDEEAVELTRAFAQQAATAVARAQAYERERAAARRLRDLDRMRTEFLATVSHELRTPLTSIEGFSETLLRNWGSTDDALRIELLGRISRNARDLHDQIEQLLDFSRLDVGSVEVHPGRLNLREAVTECVEAHAPVLEAHRVEISIPADLEVRADSHALERILMNLLTNAAKFSSPGSEIQVEAHPKGLETAISVSDRGVGIPAAEIERLFEPFYRVNDGESTVRGTGIGLTVVRRYVELHGGRISVESEPGRGSTFRFTLPRAYATRRPALARP